MDPVRVLQARSRSFGRAAARDKARLLGEIAALPRLRRADARLLEGTLDFLRAYPDDGRVLARVRALVPRLPAAASVYAWSYGTVLRLLRLFPGRLDIAWDDVEDEEPLVDALSVLVQPGEGQGLEDTRIPLRDWFAGSRPAGASDLGFLMGLLERSPLPPPVRVLLYEACDLPLRYRGRGRCAVGLPPRRPCWQRRDVARERFPLPPRIRRPPGRVTRGGRRVLDVALQALCARELEIYPLIHANPADVALVHGGRGIVVALAGVLPEWRSALESLCFFLILKNGVPVGYGPASVFLGCCEMGINLFPEFRGGEIRAMCAHLLRALHHRLGADYFFLTRYGMGEDNPDAIRTGAFWFYRKLGFVPTNPRVEELARAEEERMAARPGYRSDRATLRRLSRTEAALDLSRGRCRPLDLGRLGIAQSRFVAEEFGGDRALAERRCAARIGRTLGLPARGRALRTLAPILSMIPGLPGWSARERADLARIVRAKDAPGEARAARLFRAHPRLEAALRAIASRES